MTTKINYVPWSSTGSTLTLFVGNRTHSIHNSDILYLQIIQALREKRYGDVVQFIDKSSCIKSLSKGRFEIKGCEVFYKGKVVHNYVCNKIIECLQQGLPIEPLLAFLEKLLKNPDQRCIEAAYQFVSSENLPIDQNGNILALKCVQSNWMDRFSGQIKNKVGAIIKMRNRPKIKDYGVACSSAGFHLGNQNYINGFKNDGDNVIVVSADPQDIISLPSDSNEGKMRVCRYRVVGIQQDKLNKPIYSIQNRGKSTSKIQALASTLYNLRDKFGRFKKSKAK
ncbi:MAG: hypothetical protein AABY22_07030 [Nanoarchaeota archaeon]